MDPLLPYKLGKTMYHLAESLDSGLNSKAYHSSKEHLPLTTKEKIKLSALILGCALFAGGASYYLTNKLQDIIITLSTKQISFEKGIITDEPNHLHLINNNQGKK
ncbi:MAG: hypothetical protein ACP5OG_04180 [Candidatus Nanoarchaeia archaeon]